jgi:lambda family phage portal protein
MAVVDAYGREYRYGTYYDGASRELDGFRNDNAGPNVTVEHELQTLRSRSRQLNRNNAWSVGALESYVDDVIASGIDPEPRFPRAVMALLGDNRKAAAEKASEIREAWDLWSTECDAYQMTDIYGIQAQVVRTVCESGECFIRRRFRRPTDGLYIPMQLQILEPDYVPANMTKTADGGNRIRAGIEFDAIGRRVAYHMYRDHPGEGTFGVAPLPEVVRVPASEVIHVAELRRPGQIRFEPKTTPVISTLMNIAMSNWSILELQRVAALFGAYVVRNQEDDRQYTGDQEIGPVGESKPDDLGRAEIEMSAGWMHYLEPGEEPKFSSPPDVGGNYIPYQQFHLQQISRVFGLPYYSISGDMTGASFASLRADQNKMKRHILRILGNYRHQCCEGIYAWFQQDGVLAGRLDLPQYETMPRLWAMAVWNHTGWESTNPLQDSNANAVDLAWGLRSRRQIIAERGQNARDIDEENAEDQERARELGLSYKGMAGQSDTRGEQTGPFSDEPEIDDEDPMEETDEDA